MDACRLHACSLAYIFITIVALAFVGEMKHQRAFRDTSPVCAHSYIFALCNTQSIACNNMPPDEEREEIDLQGNTLADTTDCNQRRLLEPETLALGDGPLEEPGQLFFARVLRQH